MTRLLRLILGLWGNFHQWDDPDLVTARVSSTVPHVESVLREIQRESRQFMLLALREAGIELKAQPPIDLYPRSRVDALDVYLRPARDALRVLQDGGTE